MPIYMMTEEDYNLLDLPGSPFKLKQVPDNSKMIYIMMYSLYMKLLTEYLIRNTEIKKFDDFLQQNSELINFVSDEEKDSYQLLSNDMLKYFYVRNNLYLHNLTKEEMDFLAKKIQTNNFEYDENAENFILNTYKKLTIEELENDGELVNYGPFSNQFFAPNNSLVIGFRCESTLDYDKLIKQYKMYNEIKLKLEENIRSKLNYNVTILRYDNNSIKKKRKEGGKIK